MNATSAVTPGIGGPPLPGWVLALQQAGGNQVGTAIEQLHRAENELGDELLGVADRHQAEPEVFHVARDVAKWSHEHVRDLAAAGREYGVELDPEPEHESGVVGRLRHKAAHAAGRGMDGGVDLLDDLRRVHTMAAGVSLDWEVLAQTAQALKDPDLLGLAARCHPQTLRQMRWANTQIKVLSPQLIIGG